MAKKKRKLAGSAYSESYNTRDKGNSGRKGIFDFKGAGYDEIKWFKAKEGINRFVVIPYEIKTKNHPLVKAGKAEIGDLHYVMDIWVHKYVGPGEADVVCPKENFGKPCPICDRQAALWKNAKNEEDKKKASSLRAKRRVAYNVMTADRDGELDGEMKIFEVSHFLFEKELIEEANGGEGGNDIEPFADPEDGSIVKFRMSIEKTKEFGESPRYKSFGFEDRVEEVDDDMIDDAVSFDACLVVLSSKEIEAILNGDDIEDDEDEDEKPAKTTRSRKKPAAKKVEPEEEEDDEDDEDEEEEEEPPKRTRSRKATTKKPATRSRKKPEPEEDEEDEEDDEEEEEKPKRTRTRKPASTRSRKKVEPEEDDEEEEEEEEEKPTRSRKTAAKKAPVKKTTSRKKKPEPEEEEDDEEEAEEGVCPKGHIFGEDCDKFKKDCSRCDLWEDCIEAQEA